MEGRQTKTCRWAFLIVACGTCLYAGSAPPPGETTGKEVFRAEPQAQALYDKMIEALRQPQTLSYRSEYSLEFRNGQPRYCTYTIWLKKPNHFRVESVSPDGVRGGTIVGDGENLWLYIWRAG